VHTEPDRILEGLIKLLVDRPDEVKLHINEDPHSIVVSVEVAPSDFGKLIGRRGVYAESLRSLWSGIYGKAGKRFTLNVVDQRRSDHAGAA